MRPRGITLVGTLWFASLMLACTLATLSLVQSVRARAAASRDQTAAQFCAASGADYAEAMIRQRQAARVRHLESPDLNGCGRFRVEVTEAGGRYHIVSVGLCGHATRRIEREVAR